MVKFRSIHLSLLIILFGVFSIFGLPLNAMGETTAVLSQIGHDRFEFSTPQQKQEFITLTENLRCLVCQNQSLADSNAPLAEDLRRVVYQQLKEGKTPDEIVKFLVDRYGDFILYKPSFQNNTYLLWLGPFILLGSAMIGLFCFLRRQKHVH